ncbi:MAG: hypothetical protein ABI596_15995, partial [Pyrinomonadaceae bacterium]
PRFNNAQRGGGSWFPTDLQMGRQILVDTILQANPHFSVEDPVITIIKKELESDALLAELRVINNEELTYNPFIVELLINESTDLIQSCIQQRTELKNLEVTLLTDSINKILSRKRRSYEKAVIDADANIPAAHKTLSKQYRLKYSENSIMSDDESSDAVKRYEDTLKAARTDLRTEFETYEDLLIDFSKDANSGLNYFLRYKEKKELYWEDLKELFRKLKSLERGFATVYRIVAPLPELSQSGLLNQYYLWLKSNLLKLSKILETEQEFTLFIPIKNGFRTRKGGIAILFPTENLRGQPWRETFDEMRNAGEFVFKLPPAILEFKRHIRTRSIGVLVRTKDRQDLQEFWNLTITLPKQVDSTGHEWRIPKLVVTATNSRDLLYDYQAKSLSYFNANPFARDGDWRIEFPETSSIDNPRRSDIILDVILVLRVAVTE